MNGGVGAFEGFFQARGHLVSLGMGLGVALLFGALGLWTSFDGAAVAFFFANLPFTVWMIATLALVLFSQRARDLLAEGQTSAVGGFILRLLSPFGLFYYGWRFGFLVLWSQFSETGAGGV